jgi:hypothetical protein
MGSLTRRTGKKQSRLIREAVDMLIQQSSKDRRRAVLKKAAGMWKDRTHLPDLRSLRAEWD